jgi:RNA polymerase sigma factor CnrH
MTTLIPPATRRNMERPHPTPEPERDAFDRLVAEHHPAMRRFVFRLLAWRDGGEDVVQDVFLAAWAAWRRYPGPEGAVLWLKRIAVNKCRSRMRRDAVRARWFGWMRAAAAREPHGVAEDGLVRQERDGRVRRAIQSLESPYREAIVLHYLEQMNVDEIAAVTGQRRNTIEVRLHRARKKLETLLADLWSECCDER